MIVYANEFYLQPHVDDLETLKRAIKHWMGRKIGVAFKSTKIIPFAQPFRTRREDTGPNEVMIIGTPDHAQDYSLSINFQHNDSETRGRAWFTRIGIERKVKDAPLHVTILLETSEVSPQAAAVPVTPSQPGIVHELLKSCPLDPATPGATIRELTPASVGAFKAEVADPRRFHAVIVVSPDDFSEEPHLQVNGLRERLVGLAQVYLIPNKRDAWKLRDGLLPSFHTAWDGSITVITPIRGGVAYGRVYRGEEIEALTADTELPFDRFLFNELTHRFNLPKSRRHISDTVVGRRLVAYKLDALRKKVGNADGLQEIVESYEEDRDKAQKHAEDLEAKLLEAEIRSEKQQEEIDKLEKQVRTLQYHLNQASATAGTSEAPTAEPGPPPESLVGIPEWIEAQHPGRLAFTGRAERTLKASPYDDLEKAAAVFRILAGKFYAAFRKEIQFRDATEVLKDIPAKYSGNQSEVTAGMKDGYECDHNGKRYFLRKHIRLGSSRDPRLCFCVYFDWEPAVNTIIVLHAGGHLDTQST